MLNREEFYEFIRNNIKDFLPVEYADAEVNFTSQIKTNDVILTGLNIKKPEENVVPCIYLDSHYEYYKSEDISIYEITKRVADAYLKTRTPEIGNVANELLNYEKMKDNLGIRICDPASNRELMKGKPSTIQGDFALLYYINVRVDENESGTVLVNDSLLKAWGISNEQLHEDALKAQGGSKPYLFEVADLIEGREPVNLLENPKEIDSLFQMVALSNEDQHFGASMILNPELMKKAGELIGSDFYVLPSSIHETIFVPVGLQPISTMIEMVRDINATQVLPEEVLGDMVQFCDRSTGLIENAVEREQRLRAGINHEQDMQKTTGKIVDTKSRGPAL